MNQTRSLFRLFSKSLALTAFLGVATWSASTAAQVVTDNFDSGTLDTSPAGWQIRNICQALGGYVSDSFPANGAGKALRLQRGSFDGALAGVPQAYGTGRAWLFRTNDYTDFYVAMDLVNWNDATNQAMVLLARGSGFDEVPFGIPGLGAVNGYVANYDNAQDGTTAGDRFGGEFQINRIDSEGPSTLAAAETTLVAGHSYRIVFKGVGSLLTAQLYDFEDLSAPLVTLVADESTYPSGKSGIVTFQREDSVHPNLTDETVDNYYAAAADPNADIAPAIRHPITGTPQVVSRTPASRFTNFHPAASGLSFTAKTFSVAQINASATKLYLNGIDYSAALAPLPGNGSTVTFSTAPGTLVPNKVFRARIELEDTTGTLKSTNTLWFDTFSDGYLASAPVKTIECEDYNYSNGVHQLEPIPVSGYDTNGNIVNGSGVGYFDLVGVMNLVGTPEVDYHRNRTTVENGWNDFRGDDFVDTMQGVRQEIEDLNHPDLQPPWSQNYVRPNDAPRQKYAVVGVPEYEVFRTEATEWLNYTRDFADTNYYVFLRCGSFYTQDVELALVTSDPTVTNQTTAALGIFSVQNHLRRTDYLYEPLTSGGIPTVVHLAGTKTLRLTLGGLPSKHNRVLSLNYLLFVPTSGADPILTVGNGTAGAVNVSWPLIPYVLETSPSLSSPVWTPVLSSGITQVGGKNVYSVSSPTGAQFFRLVYP